MFSLLMYSKNTNWTWNILEKLLKTEDSRYSSVYLGYIVEAPCEAYIPM